MNDSGYIQQESEDSIFVGITNSTIDFCGLVNSCKDPGCGALSIFLGTTRDNFENKKVSFLSYEHHPTMAIKYMFKVAKEAKEKFDLMKIVVVHRVGEVKICEESVIVISASPHRESAIRSTEHTINELKRLVPIWKKEFYENENLIDQTNICKEERNGVWKANPNCLHFQSLELP